MALLIQPSFAKGELAPALYSRVDVAAYRIGLRTARNLIIHVAGGASNRPGTLFVGPVKHHDRPPRLFRFSRRDEDQYVLEMGDQYMRVIRNDGHVVETAVDIVNVTQANPARVTALAHGYANGDEVFITGVGGMTELNGNRYVVRNVDTNAFDLEDQLRGTPIDSSLFGAYTSGGLVAKIFEITTPYVQADLARLKAVQSGDVMTFTHPNYDPRDLSRADHDDWTLAIISFKPNQTHPVGIQLAVDGADNNAVWKYKVTAIGKDTGEESLVGTNNASVNVTAITNADPAVVTAGSHGFSSGDEVYLNNAIGGMTEVRDRRFTINVLTSDTFELVDEDSTNYGVYTSGGNARLTHVETADGTTAPDNTVSWTAVANADRYAVYRESNGIYGLIGETNQTSFKDSNITPDTSITPPRERNPFIGTGNFPAAASYFEQRRVFGGSDNNPDRSDYSVTGNRNNFAQSTPLQDDDAFAATLNAPNVQDIRHYVPQNDLLVFTDSGEWRINSGPDSAFTPFTIKQKPQTYWGSAYHEPILLGGSIFFVEKGDARIRSIGYTFNIDGYDSDDMTTFASHLLAYDGPDKYIVRDWTSATFPEPRLYAVRSDGKVIVMTFDGKQEVVAWSVWDTEGEFEQATSLRRSISGVEDGVYFVVRRQCCDDCPPARYIERLSTRKFADVRDGAFLDAAVLYRGQVGIDDVATGVDPLIITATAHGFARGDVVQIEDIIWRPDFDANGNEIQPDQLNGRRYIVIPINENTFYLQEVEGDPVGWLLVNAEYNGNSLDVSAETTSPQGVEFSTDGDRMYVVSPADEALYEYLLSAPFDISSAYYSGNSFHASGQDNQPLDFAFNDDGTRLFVLGGQNDSVFQYNLSTAWDLSTASYSGSSLDVSSEDNMPVGMIFSPDGSVLFVAGDQNNTIYQYDLSTDWSIGSASYSGKSLDVTFTGGNPGEIAFSGDGTKLYYTEQNGTRIEHFILDTPYDLGTVFYDGINFSVGAQDASPCAFVLSDDGTRAYMLGSDTMTIYEYVLETAWDLGTVELSGFTLDVSGQDSEPCGLTIHPEGTKLWVTGFDSDTIYEYDMSGPGLVSSVGFNGYRNGGILLLETQTITGLPHLEDCDVVVLADGEVIEGLDVSGGTLVLPAPAARVAVGLRYTADLETLDIEVPGRTVQGMKKRVVKVTIRAEKSAPFLFGPNKNQLKPFKLRQSELTGEPTGLLTGDVALTLDPKWDTNGRMFFRQRNPLPMTILGVVPDLVVGGN